jgi:hypothetical protein
MMSGARTGGIWLLALVFGWRFLRVALREFGAPRDLDDKHEKERKTAAKPSTAAPLNRDAGGGATGATRGDR